MRILLAAAALAVVACSSSGPAAPKQKAEIPPPDFEIRQLVGPAELNYEPGAIEVKFRLDIGNRATIPMTLRRIEIRTVNPDGGAYTLDPTHRAYYFNKTINPQEHAAVDFWAKANAYGRSTRENEPVTVRGTLYFQTPNGYYDQVFVKEIGQYPGQND
ncbi:MAG TPA: hypothetical protein VGQ65_13505 [Thermoanaerobaculia bacterium]|jgi:hypothetical protein|nr:hypothetical protein [Thermoanaerobaculia bacterium]